MPRQARNRGKKQAHHIICRSIDELLLFNGNKDKTYYLDLIERTGKIFGVEILSYCLMDTHVHIMVHPRNGDISKFMHGINNPYAKYYNRVHKRRGHLFAERFKNIVIKDLNQLLRNSTYIHNNPKDLLYKGYKSIEDYPYSSIKDYTQPGKGRGIAEPAYVFHQMGGRRKQVINHYKTLLEVQSQGKEKFERELTNDFNEVDYVSDKKLKLRDISVEKVVLVISKLMHINNQRALELKYHKEFKRYKALTAICLKLYCDISLSEMTKVFYNHSSSIIGYYVREGYEELRQNNYLNDQIESMLRAS